MKIFLSSYSYVNAFIQKPRPVFKSGPRGLLSYSILLLFGGIFLVTGVASNAVAQVCTNTISAPQTICSGQTPALINGNSLAGATYRWEQSPDGTTFSTALGTSNTEDYSPPALTQTTYYRRIITKTGCASPNSAPVMMTIGNPTVSAPANVSVCVGATVPLTSLTSTPAGATYNWTNSNTNIGLAASGTNASNIPGFTATNAGIAPITATIQVTPVLNGCTGTPLNYTITVNVIPPVPAGAWLPTIVVAGPNCTLAFTDPNGTIVTGYNVTGFTGSGSITLTKPNPNLVNATFSSTITSGTLRVVASNGYCTSAPSVIITLIIPPMQNVTGGGTYCSGGLPIGLAGSNAGIPYQLLRNGVSVGLPVNGTGSAISFGNQTVAGTYTVVALPCQLPMNGSATITVGTSGLWLGMGSTDWNTAANWCGNAVPTATTNVVITKATSPVPAFMPAINTNAICGDLTLGTGASLTLSGTSALNIKGNVSNAGSFTSGSGGTVNLSSNTSQTLTGVTTFNNLTVSGGGTKILNSNITVNGVLTLTSGVLSMNNNLVDVTSNSPTAVTGQTASSYVNGPLRRAISGLQTYDFPVGDATRYERMQMQITNNLGASVASVTGVFIGTDPSVGSGLPMIDNGIIDYYMCSGGYWDLSPSSPAANGARYTLSVFPVGFSSCGLNQTFVKRPNSMSNWSFNGSTFVNANKRSGIQGFSEYVPVYSNISLSVGLVNLAAIETVGQVELTWQTVSERNNDYFEVECSPDAQNFRSIGRVEGSGTTQEKNSYRFLDSQPLATGMYYRLRQVDFNGQVWYSTIISPKSSQVRESLEMFPNPLPASAPLQIKLVSAQAEEYSIAVCDLQGMMLYQEEFQAQPGLNRFFINPKVRLKNGMYVLRVSSRNAANYFNGRKYKLLIE